jgi:outer membrane protein
MGTRIQQYQQTAQKELQQKQEDILKPILEKARLAIQKVAKAKGYQYVLDASTGSGVLMAEGPDLLADVKKELGF